MAGTGQLGKTAGIGHLGQDSQDKIAGVRKVRKTNGIVKSG
jgi:hypothetical protein